MRKSDYWRRTRPAMLRAADRARTILRRDAILARVHYLDRTYR